MKKLIRLLIINFIFLLGANNVYALDISQVSLNVEDKSSTITVVDDGIGNLELNPKLEFNVVGDFITYKLVIKNNDGKKYKVENILDDNQNEAIVIKYDYNTDLNTDNKEILITLKYDQEPTNPDELLKNVKITIKLIDEDDDAQDIDINGGTNNNSPNSPQTGDSIQKYIWLLLVSLIGFTLSIIYLIKNKGKKYRKVMLSILLLLTLIPTFVFASETKEILFNINFNDIKIILKYTVSFDTKGAGEIEAQLVNRNGKATKPTDPTKEHYNFSGWYIDATFTTPYDFDEEVTSDKFLYAKYTPIEYTYAFDANGGTYSGTTTGKYTVDKEWTIYYSSNEPTREHYIFKGWTGTDISEPTKNNIVIPAGSAGDRTYTANWEKEKYTVTYDSDGGSVVSLETVDYEDTFTEPSNPTREGYNFKGWLDGSGL